MVEKGKNKMKNNKTLRQTMTGLMIASLIGLVVMTLMCVNVSGIITPQGRASMAYWSLWMENEDAAAPTDSVIIMNWKIAGAYLALIIIALASAVVKLGTSTVFAFKEQKNASILVLDILAIVAIILGIVAMFMPMLITVEKYTDENFYKNIITSAQALMYCGTPIALGLATVNGVIASKAAK